MLRMLMILSSIILTSLSAWSQGMVDLYGTTAPDVEVIDARHLGESELNLMIKQHLLSEKNRTSGHEQTLSDLRSHNYDDSKVKKFVILARDEKNPQNYSTTLLAAKLVEGSYRESDKRKHSQWGYGISLTTTLAIRSHLNGVFDAQTANFVSRALGTLTSCLVGAGKEVFYDKGKANHTVDKKDFYATCAGGAGMMIVPIDINF